MKTDKEIYVEWMNKNGNGINYTFEDRIMLAMKESTTLKDARIAELENTVAFLKARLSHYEPWMADDYKPVSALEKGESKDE